MAKLDQFKQFIATIPSIKEDVMSGRYTWQQLYEVYDMYGKEDKFWQPYKEEKNTRGVSDFAVLGEIIKNVDLNAVSSGLQALEKMLSMVSGFVVKEEPKEEPQPRQAYRWYDE